MAVDIRISGLNIKMGVLFKRQLFAAFQILLILNESLASPVWMPQFLSGGQGRNIRHLPCISRRTGEQGICMFAYTCMKSNGTHLGTCIDRFYFGSCCKMDGDDDLLSEHSNIPLISNNQVTSQYPDDSKLETVKPVTGSESSVSTERVETSTVKNGGSKNSSLVATEEKIVQQIAQHMGTSEKQSTSTEKIYVPVFTSSAKPNKTETSQSTTSSGPQFVSVSGIINRPLGPHQPSKETIETTTQQYFLSTFQMVHNEAETPTTLAPLATSTKRVTTQSATTWTPIKHTIVKNNTIVTTSSKPSITTQAVPKITTTTAKPSKITKPTTTTTTRKPPPRKTTQKPVVKPVTTAKPTTAKPVVPTKKPIPPTKKPAASVKPSSTKPTFAPKPLTTSKPSTTTKASTTTSTTTTSTTTTTTTTTPKPSPTSIVKITTSNPESTSEVIFTKPGSTFEASSITTQFGITTFRPDLSPTTSKPLIITGPGLTTFSYVSEGLKETTPQPEPSTTVDNEIHSPKPVVGVISEAQEENTNVIFQQAGTTSRPPTSTSPPEAPSESDESTKPETTSEPWVVITQSSTETDAPATQPTTTTSTTTSSIFGSLNSSDYTQVCGRRLYPESRVVGGEKSTFGKWPWQISLRQWRTSTYLHKCGAALLNDNWAITAAHCVENVPPSDLLLRLGEHDLSTEDEPYGFQERRVQIVASHPQFDPRTFEYDLALLRFYEPVKFQPNIIPVCVPEDSTNFVGQTAHVTGWGRLYEDGPLPSILQEVSVPVINNTLCENMYRSAGYIEHIPGIFICAGWRKGGFDSCEGDSGGPMVIQRPDKRWLLAGVISWGIGCAEPNQPGVYTRISEFREWIHQILQF